MVAIRVVLRQQLHQTSAKTLSPVPVAHGSDAVLDALQALPGSSLVKKASTRTSIMLHSSLQAEQYQPCSVVQCPASAEQDDIGVAIIMNRSKAHEQHLLPCLQVSFLFEQRCV